MRYLTVDKEDLDMGLLSGKTAIIFGLANERSIAWGIAKAFQEQGAELGFSYHPAVEKYARPLATQLGGKLIEPCDVTSDEQIEQVALKVKELYGEVDILVHAVAFAGRSELEGAYLQTTRAGFAQALDISVYSFTAMARYFEPVLRPYGSLITLTYYGADKVAPNYNVMGIAKAALEASVRYLAYDLGPRQIRVNAISAGPIRTLSAAGVAGFKAMYRHFTRLAPLQQNIQIEDVGNTAVYLASDLSTKVTGEVIFVDSGYNILAFPIPPCD
jgi:enoyl-[acyl-carrier protein] reductase I